MNYQSTVFLSILSRCNPTDAELKRESNLQSIIHSETYRELAARKAFRPYFDELFTLDKLRSYTDNELDSARRAVNLIPMVLEDVIFSLRNGAAPSLTPADKPDFLNPSSLQKLIDKLHLSTGKNYTNISPDDFMRIFEPNTIRTIGTDFGQLDSNCSDFSSAISQMYAGRSFCISDAEIHAQEVAYRRQIADLNESIESTKKQRKLRSFIKGELGLIALFIPAIVGGITGSISSGAIVTCTLFELILVLGFWILG